MKILMLALLAIPLIASAQVRKCQGVDGKIVYSDVLCTDTRAKESAVNTSANTIDHSGLRALARQQRESEELAALNANPPHECRFQAYKYGDEKGQVLRKQATQECIGNIVAVKSGKPASSVAYERWKDHYGQTSADRNAALARSAADSNTQRIIESQKASSRRLGNKIDEVGRNAAMEKTCKPDFSGTRLICK